ncbi:MAG: hypothetical protein ACK40L_14910, partial [Hydrogenophaga sp.]
FTRDWTKPWAATLLLGSASPVRPVTMGQGGAIGILQKQWRQFFTNLEKFSLSMTSDTGEVFRGSAWC